MDVEATGSRGRLLAFRIVGWAVGVISIVPSIAFLVLSLVSDDPIERGHRFHYAAGLVGFGLIGLFTILWVLRPAQLSLFHVLVAQTVAAVIGGLMGGDLISGVYVLTPVILVVLVALHPDRPSLRRLPGRPSVALLTYAVIAAVPAWIYAVTYAELQRGPASDPHVEAHHWSGVAIAALAVAGTGIAASLRGSGWTVATAAASVAAALFGVAGLAFGDRAGAPDPAWSWLAIAAGVGFWLLSRVEASRERVQA